MHMRRFAVKLLVLVENPQTKGTFLSVPIVMKILQRVNAAFRQTILFIKGKAPVKVCSKLPHQPFPACCCATI